MTSRLKKFVSRYPSLKAIVFCVGGSAMSVQGAGEVCIMGKVCYEGFKYAKAGAIQQGEQSLDMIDAFEGTGTSHRVSPAEEAK
jgi:hypothetical protein